MSKRGEDEEEEEAKAERMRRNYTEEKAMNELTARIGPFHETTQKMRTGRMSSEDEDEVEAERMERGEL